MTTVVAALIERGGRVLIGQRRRGEKHHALKWEFPGGKLEAGESPPEALRRELTEELGIAARIGPEVERYEYCYPGRTPVLLVFFQVKEFAGEPRNLAFEKLAWEPVSRLPEYDFLEGDVDFVRRLVR